MGDLGERLRQERESRGISLHEIAQKTRIGVRMLKAIEEEAFEQLPGGIFNKSFIQQYAQYLGLDEKQAVRDYLRATATARETPTTLGASAPRPASTSPSSTVRKFTLGVAGIGLIALVIWLMLPASRTPDGSGNAAAPPSSAIGDASTESGAASASQPTMSAEEQAAAVSSEISRDPSESAREEESPRRGATTESAAAELLRGADDAERSPGEVPEELLLQINARSTVWISITADGERAWQGTMQANQTREVQAAETIRLTVGNAGGVELTLNGKNLGSLGGEGEVKTVTLAARALQEAVP